VIFLQNTKSEKFILHIMEKINIIKKMFQYEFKQIHLFEEIVE